MGQALSVVRGNATDGDNDPMTRSSPPPAESSEDERPSGHISDEGAQYTVVQSREERRKKKKQTKKLLKHYPEILHSPDHRLHSPVKTSNLQELALYLMADGLGPKWVAVKNHTSIAKLVVLMVPGLEVDMFTGAIPLDDNDEEDDKEEESTGSKEPRASSNGHLEHAKGLQPHKGTSNKHTGLSISSHDYHPTKLAQQKLPPILQPLADIFPQIWQIQAAGDDRYNKLHSPLQSMLVAPIPKRKDGKNGIDGKHSKSGGSERPQYEPTPVDKFILSTQGLIDNDYILHPSCFETEEERSQYTAKRHAGGQDTEHGWVDSNIPHSTEQPSSKSPSIDDLTAGMQIYAMDCEFVETTPKDTPQFELARISLLNYAGEVVLDTLVKPNHPITNYLTQYSGLTQEKLAGATTTLSEIQTQLLALLTPTAVLLGHSLDSDLTVLRLTHPHIIDTSSLYPHPRGPPLKSSLKYLANKYLSREIQTGHGVTGHDSIEDAKAVLDLVKLKLQRGPRFGTGEADKESIFTRIGRSKRHKPSAGATNTPRRTAVVDWGHPRRGYGGHADVAIACKTDQDVVAGIAKAINGTGDDEASNGTTTTSPLARDAIPRDGVDFCWARLRELDAVRGWWNKSKTTDGDELREAALSRLTEACPDSNSASASDEPSTKQLQYAVHQTISHVQSIYDSLPPTTAFILYSGSGDPRPLWRMHDLRNTFQREWKTTKWDQLSVQWTDVEDQALRAACSKARAGVGFLVVK